MDPSLVCIIVTFRKTIKYPSIIIPQRENITLKNRANCKKKYLYSLNVSIFSLLCKSIYFQKALDLYICALFNPCLNVAILWRPLNPLKIYSTILENVCLQILSTQPGLFHRIQTEMFAQKCVQQYPLFNKHVLLFNHIKYIKHPGCKVQKLKRYNYFCKSL